MFVDSLSRSARAAELIRRRMAGLAPLSDADLEVIEAACLQIDSHPAGAVFSDARIIVSGWGCRRHLAADGARQILSFALPGDLVDARAPAARNRRGYVALTAVESVSAAGLMTAAGANPHLGVAEALAALRNEQEKLLQDQIVRLGRLSAYQRTVHLLLELRERLARLGLADDHRLPVPLTQEVLADTLGLSIVHVNRTLQQLRREGLIKLRAGVAVLPDPEALADLCGFEPEDRRLVGAGPFPAVASPSFGASPLA